MISSWPNGWPFVFIKKIHGFSSRCDGLLKFEIYEFTMVIVSNAIRVPRARSRGGSVLVIDELVGYIRV